MAKGTGLGGQVDFGIDEILGGTIVEAGRDDGMDGGPDPVLSLITIGDMMCKLLDHIRTRGHFPALTFREFFFQFDAPSKVGFWIGEKHEDVSVFVPEHHVPGESMSFFGPMDCAWIKKMAKRNEQLKHHVNMQQADDSQVLGNSRASWKRWHGRRLERGSRGIGPGFAACLRPAAPRGARPIRRWEEN